MMYYYFVLIVNLASYIDMNQLSKKSWLVKALDWFYIEHAPSHESLELENVDDAQTHPTLC